MSHDESPHAASLFDPLTPPDVEPQPTGELPLADRGLDDAARDAISPLRHLAAAVALALFGAVPAMAVVMVGANLPALLKAFPTTQIGWVQTVGTLAGAVLSLPVGKAGDIFGKKKVLLILAALVITGSVLCATTQSFPLFLLGRTLTGLCIGFQICYFGLIRDTFPRRWVPGAVAGVVGVFTVGISASVLVGGWLVDHHGYQAMFWFMAAYTAVAALLTAVVVLETPLRTRDRMDWNSIGLLAVGIFAVTYGLNESSVPGRGWSSPWTVSFLLVGLLLCVAWGFYERRPEQSTVGMNLLANRAVNRTLVVVLLTGVMLLIIALVSPSIAAANPHQPPPGPGYGLKGTAASIGRLELFPAALATVIALVSGLWARYRGAWGLLVAGPLVFAVGMVMQAYVTTSASLFGISYGVYQAGVSLLLVAYPLLIIEAVPAHASGVGLAMATVFQSMGTSIGTQLVVAINNAHIYSVNPATGSSVVTHAGIQLDLFMGAAFGVVSFVIALFVRHGRTRSSGGALPDARAVTTTSGALRPVRVGGRTTLW